MDEEMNDDSSGLILETLPDGSVRSAELMEERVNNDSIETDSVREQTKCDENSQNLDGEGSENENFEKNSESDIVNKGNNYNANGERKPSLSNVMKKRSKSSLESSESESNTCDLCLQSYRTRSTYLRHRNQHESSEYPCTKDECTLKFVSKISRRQHIEKTHKKRTNEQGPPYVCEVCGRQFSRFYDRNAHERLHSVEDGFICTECGKVFKANWALKHHKSVHLAVEERKKFLCEDCGKEYTSKSALVDHKKRHLGESGKNYTCDVCGARFFKLSGLKTHIESHTANTSPWKFKCGFCEKIFPNERRLKAHRQSVHPSKLLSCQVCGKGFKTNKDMRRHQKIHAGVKDYECSYCARAFVQKNNLVAHIRTHTGEKPYTCEHCSSAFNQPQQLKSHSTHCSFHKGELQ